MTASQQATVDVRDMLCAQALAQVSQALGRLDVGTWLTVASNAEDVRRDLVVWAREQGHKVWARPPMLRIRRGVKMISQM